MCNFHVTRDGMLLPAKLGHWSLHTDPFPLPTHVLLVSLKTLGVIKHPSPSEDSP